MTFYELHDQIAELELKLSVAQTERDAALSQLHEQNQKLDAALAALDAYRRDL